jgi:membrane protein implicated in regulation of membrane protease activity
VCLIAPSAEHRWVFRHDDKHHLVFASNRIVIAGLVFLAFAMCGCLLLVTTNLLGAGWGVLITAFAAVPFLLLWFAIPIRRAAALSAEEEREEARTGER